MQNALRTDLYFYSTVLHFAFSCANYTLGRADEVLSLSDFLIQFMICNILYIKNNHQRGDFDYSKMKNCLILEDDLTV